MYRIERDELSVVAPLLEELAEMQLHVAAVLAGTSRGEVYADDRRDPSAAYVVVGEGHYLAARGRLPCAFVGAANALLPRDRLYALFYDGSVAPADLQRVVAHTYAVPARRTYMRLREPLLPDWRSRVGTGFAVRRVEGDLARGDLAEDILEEWASLEAYEAQGFGACAVHEGQVVSCCLADYARGQRCEIGVWTNWHFRRRGLATLVTAAAVEQALAMGYSEIGWHRWSNNVGSDGVARKAGFEPVIEYEILLNHWAAENVSDMPADEFRAFAEGYERAFEVESPASGFPHIVAAKAWSLCGDRERCYSQIESAVRVGWLRSVDHLREMWPEFFSFEHLDRGPTWQRIAQQLD